MSGFEGEVQSPLVPPFGAWPPFSRESFSHPSPSEGGRNWRLFKQSWSLEIAVLSVPSPHVPPLCLPGRLGSAFPGALEGTRVLLAKVSFSDAGRGLPLQSAVPFTLPHLPSTLMRCGWADRGPLGASERDLVFCFLVPLLFWVWFRREGRTDRSLSSQNLCS